MTPDDNDRKVLMVLESCFPTEGGGGAEGQVRTISRYLRECGLPVTIVVPMVPRGVQQEHDRVDGVPVWRIPYPVIRKVGGLVLLAKLAWFLFRQRHSYDVIHAHIAHQMAALCAVAGRLLGKPVIVKVTGSLELSGGFLDPTQKGLRVALQRVALRQANYFQATSSEIRDRLLDHGFAAERVRVIPNAVDVGRFAAASAARAARGEGPRTAVYVGRLEHDKGTDVLVSAWIKAFPSGSGMRLLLVGEGRQRAMLEEMIRAHGRMEEIRLLGPQQDVPAFLARADFAVLPSRFEGLSNALLEYMAAGLPVLGSRVSGTEDFVEPGRNGWLFDAENVDELAGCLRQIAAMDCAQLQVFGEQSQRRVIARARIDAVVARLAELYQINANNLKHVPGGEYVQAGGTRR